MKKIILISYQISSYNVDYKRNFIFIRTNIIKSQFYQECFVYFTCAIQTVKVKTLEMFLIIKNCF